ncbi:unnamed protein product [Darwinula stevensoni]|uniref:START domain-containing protein n=1 Tax=Darwinula stevensoni TaxID=69355 RepID=A0A7R8X738_9CRUS|nr:unnamed protein product [Darwinula stevensoni]CAG0882769.1 unnamed protein product [Darwinula stevensoni]
MGRGLITDLLSRSLCFSLQFLLYEKVAEVTNPGSESLLLHRTNDASYNLSRSQLRLEDEPIPTELQPYFEQGKKTYESFKLILDRTAWEPMTTMSDDVIKIASAYNRESGITMFYLELVVNVSAEVVFREDWDHVPDYPKWNPNFLHTEVVLDITSRCRLTYQVTTPIGNGLIWSRDAVTIAYWNKEGDATYLAFSSTSWPALPPSNRYVRATFYPQGFVYSPLPGDPEKTLVRWVYHVDVHLAFVPARVLNLVLPKACRDSFMYYRKHAEDLMKEWKGE